MRKATLASLLIVCGSTAAIAQVTQTPTDPVVQGNAIDNTAAPADPVDPANPADPAAPMTTGPATVDPTAPDTVPDPTTPGDAVGTPTAPVPDRR